MRGMHRIKNKVELRLDNSQIFILFIGSLVLGGLIFVLGVMVGQRIGPPLGDMAPVDTLAAIDTRAETPPVTTTDEPTAGNPTEDAKDADEGKDAVEESQELVFYRELEKVDVPGEALPPKQLPTREDVAAKPDKAAAEEQATEKAADQERVAPPRYTIQVASHQDEAQAQRIVALLNKAGHDSFIEVADIPERGRWYRVRVGRFGSKDEATAYRPHLGSYNHSSIITMVGKRDAETRGRGDTETH